MGFQSEKCWWLYCAQIKYELTVGLLQTSVSFFDDNFVKGKKEGKKGKGDKNGWKEKEKKMIKWGEDEGKCDIIMVRLVAWVFLTGG